MRGRGFWCIYGIWERPTYILKLLGLKLPKLSLFKVQDKNGNKCSTNWLNSISLCLFFFSCLQSRCLLWFLSTIQVWSLILCLQPVSDWLTGAQVARSLTAATVLVLALLIILLLHCYAANHTPATSATTATSATPESSSMLTPPLPSRFHDAPMPLL